jgi:hypothetical protein
LPFTVSSPSLTLLLCVWPFVSTTVTVTVVDVPIGGLITDEELALDLGAIGRPGPLYDWSILSNVREEDGGATTRTIRLVHHTTQHTLARVFARDPLRRGDTDVLWRRIG